MKNFVVIGAGPAGLAFAASVAGTDTLLVDQGKSATTRNRNDPCDCVQGAGGAGLFSDGKFSFYPSGTAIWRKERDILLGAYSLLERELASFGPMPAFPMLETSYKEPSPDAQGWRLKPYPSLYLSLESRLRLIKNLSDRIAEKRMATEFIDYHHEGDHILVKLRSLSSKKTYWIATEKLVLAGGRFMPLFLNGPSQFRRQEFGFRVEGPADLIQKETDLTDPKYIFQQGDVEYRTFCWCERGETTKTQFNGIETYSGRADGPATDRSNFGFNIRVKDPHLIPHSEFRALLHMQPYRIPIQEATRQLLPLLPQSAGTMVTHGLAQLLTRFPRLNSPHVHLLGPTIEGVGEYPAVNENGELMDFPGVFVIGDSGGTYRGIVASMLSGYTLALQENQNSHAKVRVS